jgi:hypothetical protein
MGMLSLWVDESEKGSLLAVGGVLVEWDAVLGIIQQWHQMKVELGLDPHAEVKWNLPQGHPTRKRLESQARTTRDLAEKAIQTIVSTEIYCIVAVMFDLRQLAWWKRIWSKASVRDFYCEGLRYVLQRAAEEVVERQASGCVVVCDTPGLGKDRFVSGSIRRGPKALEEAYAKWYVAGVEVGPGWRHHHGALKEIGFHPSALVSDATFHDMLQIADVVVGITRDWVVSVEERKSEAWLVEQMKALSQRFRSRHGYGVPPFWGDGLILWPHQDILYQHLQQSLKP